MAIYNAKNGLIVNLYRWLCAFGFNPRTFLYAIRSFLGVLADYRSILEQKKHSKINFKVSFNHPNLSDKHAESGVAKGHYFHQDFYIAQKVFNANPEKHVDIASKVDSFVAHVAVFRKIEVLDIRRLESPLENLIFNQLDIMGELEGYQNYCDSLSCLHALEHFGLGRYGDPLDFEGHIKGINNIKKILKPNGTLYLSVPIGPERIEFNAHRVFNPRTIINLLKPNFSLVDFSYVDDDGDMHVDIDTKSKSFDNSMNCNYGCGIFTFIKEDL
tara:strand:+ start:2109 stop:2924 length:816 start_codon:yes stop_codon:yes gene_type:complete